jgi:hypothetical protein
VCINKGSGQKWFAQITYDGKGRKLGNFATKEEAALAYDRVARQCGKVAVWGGGDKKQEKITNFSSLEEGEQAVADALERRTAAKPRYVCRLNEQRTCHTKMTKSGSTRWYGGFATEGEGVPVAEPLLPLCGTTKSGRPARVGRGQRRFADEDDSVPLNLRLQKRHKTKPQNKATQAGRRGGYNVAIPQELAIECKMIECKKTHLCDKKTAKGRHPGVCNKNKKTTGNEGEVVDEEEEESSSSSGNRTTHTTRTCTTQRTVYTH